MTETQALQTALDALHETILDAQTRWTELRERYPKLARKALCVFRRQQARRYWHARLARNYVYDRLLELNQA